MRGGTSKAVFFKKNELPSDPALRDKVILAAFGSPDVRQIDGLGGADVLTSKLAIIGPSTSPEADVDYTFAQVSFTEALVDYSGNCGNISSAVGPFAIDEGMVSITEPVTTVRIHLTNSDQIFTAYVPVVDGKAAVEGDFRLDGVPGTGAEIIMDWSRIIGPATGKLLPTGKAVDEVEVEGTTYRVSLVDAGNPLVFIKAEELGLTGTETCAEIEADTALTDRIEAIRQKCAEVMGVPKSNYIPFFSIIGDAGDYTALNDKQVKKEEIDFTARLLFMQHMHKSYPVTGAVCTGAAARIPGSVVYEKIRDRSDNVVRVGHPAGVMPIRAEAEEKDGEAVMTQLGVYRTARRIMDGTVYIKKSVYSGS